jgi:ABC-2 type transport system permease protein
MSKTWAVFKREYLQVVRKKSFLIMTVLTPFLLGGLMLVPSLLTMKGLGVKKVAIVDGTGGLETAIADGLAMRSGPLIARGERGESPMSRQPGLSSLIQSEYVGAAGGNVDETTKPLLDRLYSGEKERRLDGVLVVPARAFDDPKLPLTYYSRSATDLIVESTLGRVVNAALQRQRLAARGVAASEVDSLLRDLPMRAVQLTKGGEQKPGGKMNFLVGIVFVIMIFVPMLAYGQEILRGIIQEKTDRVVEILISSMTPMELLSGKILGMAAVGLTQIAVWMAMSAVLAVYGAAIAAAAGVNLGQFLRADLAAWSVVFFILGYLINVCLYAVGGAIVNSEKEAQQVIGPLMIVMMVPWFLMSPILMNPDSTLSTVLSLIPVYTPITMFIRVLVSEPPFWQLALSVALGGATVVVLLWATAKIFRLGLLAYGKRPTIPELWRWLKVA